jgi:hypothetical protein
MWKGPEALGARPWKRADLDPTDRRSLHIQQLCHAPMSGRMGLGVLEQLVDPHAPSGLQSILEPAV